MDLVDLIFPAFLLLGYYVTIPLSNKDIARSLEFVFFILLAEGYIMWFVNLNTMYWEATSMIRLISEYILFCINVSLLVCLYSAWHIKHLIFPNKDRPSTGIVIMWVNTIPLATLTIYLVAARLGIATIPPH